MTEDEALRLAEALVFASAGPVGARALSQLLPEDAGRRCGAGRAARALCRARRRAGRGAGGVQFRTAPDLAPLLRKVVEMPRRLPRVAMETLAIIAYHQPVTRPEIEEIRGASLSQQTLDALLEAGLIAPKGRREKPGPADAVGHHAAVPGPVRPEGPARTAAARGPAAGAAAAGRQPPRRRTRRRSAGAADHWSLTTDRC